jgi:uncharacterized UBP type Zn finger protein
VEKKGLRKITCEVSFPVDQLNLSPELPKLQKVAKMEVGQCFLKEKPIYELLGVICHSGSLNKGHYYTYAKNKVEGGVCGEVMFLGGLQMVRVQ